MSLSLLSYFNLLSRPAIHHMLLLPNLIPHSFYLWCLKHTPGVSFMGIKNLMYLKIKQSDICFQKSLKLEKNIWWYTNTHPLWKLTMNLRKLNFQQSFKIWLYCTQDLRRLISLATIRSLNCKLRLQEQKPF